MEAPASEYFYTLSILAISFAVASALVTAVRQIAGGSLSQIDIHLLTTFMSAGFVLCIAAMLPSAIGLFHVDEAPLWTIASIAAALATAAVIVRTQWQRRRLAALGLGRQTFIIFAALWLSVAMLGVNAIVLSLQGVALYAGAITLCLATVMWAFVRRIASLGDIEAQRDWHLE
jgi:hypothetical protein